MIDRDSSKPQPAEQPLRPQANKKLIATLPELEIAVTYSKIRPVTFSNKIIYLTQVRNSGSLFLHERKPQSVFNLERNSRFTEFTSLRSGTFSNGLPVFCFLLLRGAFMALLEMLQKY